jgi:hypothetical protein
MITQEDREFALQDCRRHAILYRQVVTNRRAMRLHQIYTLQQRYRLDDEDLQPALGSTWAAYRDYRAGRLSA